MASESYRMSYLTKVLRHILRYNKRKLYYLLVHYLQTSAQPPFRGHLPWSRGCPLNKGSIMATLGIVFGRKKTLFEERSPFSKIRLELDSKLDGRFTQILLTFK